VRSILAEEAVKITAVQKHRQVYSPLLRASAEPAGTAVGWKRVIIEISKESIRWSYGLHSTAPVGSDTTKSNPSL